MLHCFEWNNVRFFMEKQKFKHRSVIEFLTNEGVAPENIHERSVNECLAGQKALRVASKKWAAEFKTGRNSIEDGLAVDGRLR